MPCMHGILVVARHLAAVIKISAAMSCAVLREPAVPTAADAPTAPKPCGPETAAARPLVWLICITIPPKKRRLPVGANVWFPPPSWSSAASAMFRKPHWVPAYMLLSSSICSFVKYRAIHSVASCSVLPPESIVTPPLPTETVPPSERSSAMYEIDIRTNGYSS